VPITPAEGLTVNVRIMQIRALAPGGADQWRALPDRLVRGRARCSGMAPPACVGADAGPGGRVG